MIDVTPLQMSFDGDVTAGRDTYIGGSDAGVIMGLCPYKSAYTLWAEKTGKKAVEDISDKEAVWWGHYDEQGVALRFTEKTGIKVAQSNKTYFLQEYPYMVGHIDRKVVGDHVGLECKTTTAWNKTEYDSGDIPPYHYAQCQHYMMVTGWNKWYLATKRDNTQFHILEIPRNEDFIEELLHAEIEFWNCVQSDTPPLIDGSTSTSETLSERYAGDEDIAPVTIDSEQMKEYQAVTEHIKQLENIKAQYENEFKETMKDATVGLCDGYKVTWKPTPTTRFDSKKFKEDDPETYDKYCKTTESRRFAVRKVKEIN